jgi:hypothetical protein
MLGFKFVCFFTTFDILMILKNKTVRKTGSSRVLFGREIDAQRARAHKVVQNLIRNGGLALITSEK